MRLRKLHLKAFGPFTDRVLDFGAQAKGVVLVHGPNEAGKTSALRAMADLRFGIPLQSKDNFLHEHAEMRIGGEFVDRHGKTYSLMRRKGRGATLMFADFDLGGLTTEEAVPPEVEALLNCGLDKDAYDLMFGLDHRRLREGGQALLKGEGDVGAALFEASAGVRSIPQVLERLDASARKLFMPGARGKNARINEALATYDDRHTEFKQAQVRPAQWTEIFKKHQTAAAELAELELRRLAIGRRLLLINEVRAVAPLLSTLDNATRVLTELTAVPLLSETVSTERAAAEAGLFDARHNATLAAADATREQAGLDDRRLDDAILAVGPAVKRLAASAEAIDQHRRDIADAAVDVDSETILVAGLAAGIDASSATEQVLSRAPTKVQRAVIHELLRDFELARQAFDQHLEAGKQSADPQEAVIEGLPSAEARTALRIAQAEVTRSDGDLKRLAALPAEIKSARRAATAALVATGLEDDAALGAVRLLLDAQIDAALTEQSGYVTRRAGFEARVTQIADALPAAIEDRDLLLQRGSVATRDDVDVARQHREAGWALVRGKYVDRTISSGDNSAGEEPPAQVYERAVSRADQAVDAFASDIERAAQLQGSNRVIETLERDRAELVRLLEEIDRADHIRQASWTRALSTSGLPSLSPAALRDWQALLPVARTSCEKLQAKLDEFEEVQSKERALASRLRAAILGTALAMPAEDQLLSTLAATAVDLDGVVKRREAAVNKAAGKDTERERQRQQMAARETALGTALHSAKDALGLAMTGLLLPAESSVSAARARLAEFDALVDAMARLTAAQVKKQRARQALSVLATAALAIRESLGDMEPIDLRLYVERIIARLEAAEAVQTARLLAHQAVDRASASQRDHARTAERHEKVIATLCAAAGVESVVLMPEAEARSRRKRDAQEEVDRTGEQLALASRRSIDELRALLVDQDLAQINADEMSHSQEQIRVDERLRIARGSEEGARRALEAVDGSDTAAAAREAMERAAASVRANMSPWIRSKLAHALLSEALRRFRDRAQGPMLHAASGYFARMTRGEFVRLHSDDSGKEPVLIAERSSGPRIRVEAMSEGTLDQLYLALRLAALDVRRAAGVDLPVILDDVLMTSDDDRSGVMLEALADFAHDSQVIVFTHHRHIVDIAVRHVPHEVLVLVPL
ncbi:MAG: AAA family ATPase [Burkholderiaceae bacterium]